MSTVNELLKELRENITHVEKNEKGEEVVKIHATASQKDEVRVMKEMLNDKEYEVGVYNTKGKVGTYNPSEDARKMIASIISSATKIKLGEATDLAENYEFSNKEAQSMVSISKEFINTYMQTGRGMSLGGRETFRTKLKMVHVDEHERTRPRLNKEASEKAGQSIYENTAYTVSEHDAIKAKSPCPSWLKNKENK